MLYFIFPPKYEDVQSNLKMAEKIISTNRGLFLYGPAGTGKTHTAYSILSGYLEIKKIRDPDILRLDTFIKTYPPIYAQNANDLFLDLSLAYTNFGKQDFLNSVDKVIRYSDLVFIDDLGAEQESEKNRGLAYKVINQRYESGKPLLLTSNIDIEKIALRYGNSIASRICEMCELSSMEGEDKRLI